jgi:hypothetical protein
MPSTSVGQSPDHFQWGGRDFGTAGTEIEPIHRVDRFPVMTPPHSVGVVINS